MVWFLVNWLFAWLVGSLLAYAIIKKMNNERVLPFDMELWSSTWVPGVIGAFLGTAVGQLIMALALA